MASTQRIKGQEVAVLITRAGVLEDTLTHIMNFNLVLKLEIKEQGYLGDPTDEVDEIFHGIKGDFELHIARAAYFDFAQAIIDRAQRLTPDVVFNITAVLNFPNGEVVTAMAPDVKFGELPMNIGSRGDYVKSKVEFGGSKWVRRNAA